MIAPVPDEPYTTPAPAAHGSPMDDLRADYEARQTAAEPVYVNIRGRLVAQVASSADISGARGAMRSMAVLAGGNDIDLTLDDLADVVAAATAGLHKREDDGTFTAWLDDTGCPVRFGAAYSAAMGHPSVTEPRDAVLLAFTEGSPPDVNALMLMAAASNIAAAIVTDRAESTATAESVVGEASARRT